MGIFSPDMSDRHSKRAFWHDYRSRSIYFITINKRAESPSFGVLAGDWKAPAGSSLYPCIKRSPLGVEVLRQIKRLPEIIPSTQLYQYVVMPDHIHFLIFVKAPLPLHLGNYISQFKNELRKKVGYPVFAPGFNDQILSVTRKLDSIFNYIRENPYRLAARRANPEFFMRCDSIRLNGRRYTGYGNLFLLKNPFREAVIVHRRYSEEEREAYKRRWLHLSSAGSVMVSPFIAKGEKEVRKAVEEIGGKVILIVEKPLPPAPYKPSGHNFYQCLKGELLILAPYEWDEAKDGREGSRQACLRMNALAEYLAARAAT
ncbi:MAG: hypothetical protein HDS28_06800 [Bacteroides sp.]|nr:hypothetical protein [Bacteroides sp.]